MNLRSFVPEIDAHLVSYDLMSLNGMESFGDYEVDLEREVSLGSFDEAITKFAGRELKSEDDAAMAIAVHTNLVLTLREASDRYIWWWLCVRRCPGMVNKRWANGATSTLSRERMLGPVNRNAFARLWWGAQLVSELDDPAKYTKLMFRNQDLFEAVIGRKLARYPHALQVILDEWGTFTGAKIRTAIKALGFVLSTMVLECVDPDQLRSELRNIMQ